MQGVVENFFGALILQSRRPFTIGDTVRLDEHVGAVKDIDSRTVVMRGLDGTWIRVPNSKVLKDPIVTLTTETFRRSGLAVGVAYDTDLTRATNVIGVALGRVAWICDDPPPLAVLRRFGTSSIDYDVYYWHASDVPAELAARHGVMLAIHQAFSAEDITIAFPQMVVCGRVPTQTTRPPADRSTARSTPSTQRYPAGANARRHPTRAGGAAGDAAEPRSAMRRPSGCPPSEDRER